MKTILITGATDGIGKQTALNIAQAGHSITIVGRNKEKCDQTVNEFISQTKNENINYIQADLSLISEVNRISSHIKDNFSSLDILINNVGALFSKREETGEGFEKTFALNHLSSFALTLNLIDLLKESNHPRIVNVASDAHLNVVDKNTRIKRSFIESLFFKTNFDIDDIQCKNNYKGGQQYSKTKLMNILFTYKLSRDYLSDTNITANCLHPGFVASKFGHNNGGFIKSFLKFGQALQAISLIDGAVSSTHLALSEKLENISGKYFDECGNEKRSLELSYDEALQDSLWKQSKDLIDSIR